MIVSGEKELKKIPKVSVVMPIYNGEKHLGEAIQSVLNNTYKDFELILIIEYGSNEKSKEIARGFSDSRINIIENVSRLGLAESLNVGIRHARGEYIARMDADDISYPNRIGLQVDFLDKHKDIAIVGANALINGKKYRKTKLPQQSEEIRFVTFFRNAMIHPSVMWKKSVLEANNIYYSDVEHSEDYELWTRVVDRCKLYNLPQAVIAYRVDGTGKSMTSDWQQSTYEMRNELLKKHGVQFDTLESFFEKSSSRRIFDSKCDAIRKVTSEFEFESIRRVFTRETAKMFVINEIKNPKRLYSCFRELYKPINLPYIYFVYGMELIKYSVRDVFVRKVK